MAKPIKILFVATASASGMRPFAASIANTLAADERFEVHIICCNKKGESYESMISKKANPIFVEMPNHFLGKLVYKVWPFRVIRQIKTQTKKINPDVVHFLTGDFCLAYYISLHNKSNYYYTVHDLHPHEVEKMSKKDKFFRDYFVIRGNRICREKINNLTTSSRSQMSQLHSLFPYKHCEFTCFPSLVTKGITTGTQFPKEINTNDKYILFFGNVNRYKGVDLLMEAFTKYVNDSNCKLVIAGKGHVYETHDKRIIRICRFIDDSEIAELFKRAQYIVYPYRSATMSGVLSIAYYFNKKILASDIPFFIDNITSNIELFKCGDVTDMGVQMNRLLRQQNLNVDKDSYNKLYSQQALADSYYNLYKNDFKVKK